jgi:hypothetical protein
MWFEKLHYCTRFKTGGETQTHIVLGACRYPVYSNVWQQVKRAITRQMWPPEIVGNTVTQFSIG